MLCKYKGQTHVTAKILNRALEVVIHFLYTAAPTDLLRNKSIEMIGSTLILKWNFKSLEMPDVIMEIFINYKCYNTYPETYVSVLLI